MAIFRNRFPSKRDIVLVFASCVVPVYSWSIVSFFKRMSSRWVFFLNPWDSIGVFAYAQMFAFLESATFLLVLILLSVILPARFLRRRFAAQGSTVAFLTSVFAIVLQFKLEILLSPGYAFFLGLALLFVSCGVACVLIHRYRRLEEFIYAFVERLTVLLYIYVTVTFPSIIIVVFRNI